MEVHEIIELVFGDFFNLLPSVPQLKENNDSIQKMGLNG